MKTRTLLPRFYSISDDFQRFCYMCLILLLSLLAGNSLQAQCPQDIQPSCPIITNAVMDQTDNGDGTSDYVIYIDWIQGTANNASLQWDVYAGSIICPEEYDDLGLYPVENCIHVHDGNSSGTINDYLNGVPNSNTVYLVAQGRTNATCGGNICNQTFVQVAPRPVPVKLVKFEGELINDQVLLEWTTESEVQNEGFVIERSQNSIEFDEVDFVEGNGTTTSMNSYQYRDDLVLNATSYYRLKQVDFDGGYAYSDVIRIENRKENNQYDFSMYPNPISNDILTIQTEDFMNTSIEIIDNQGKRVFYSMMETRQIEISTSEWPEGMYNVLYLKNDHFQVKRLIKND